MSNRKKEVAKFFCGFEAFHTLFHAYLWMSDTAFTAFGVTATPTRNVAGTILNGGIALVLGLYRWRAAEPQQNAGRG
jgi:hypothetical protein